MNILNKLLCFFGIHRFINKTIESKSKYSSISYEYPGCRVCSYVNQKHYHAIGIIKWDQKKND